MEVLLPKNQEAQLNDLALRTGRGTDDLIQEAVARMLARNARFKEQVQIGIDQIARAANSSKRTRWTPASSGCLNLEAYPLDTPVPWWPSKWPRANSGPWPGA
jgi:hypothetical protein